MADATATSRCTRCERELPLSEFATDRSKHRGVKSWCKRCDNARSKAYYHKPKFRNCLYCSKPSIAGPQGGRFCTPICADLHSWERRNPPLSILTCAECGNPWARTTGSTALCCSLRCKQARSRRQARELERRTRRNRHHSLARRAATTAGDVTAHHIAELLRRRHQCPLCGTRMTNRHGHPHSKHIDHIMPLCVGGTHTIGNLRVICRTCNLQRPTDGSDYTGPITLWAADHDIVESRQQAAARAKAERDALRRARQAKAHARTEATRRRAEQALQLRRTGLRWQDIADQLGYANTSGPYLAIQQTLRLDPKSIL